MSFSAEIGWAVMEELSKYRGCDIQNIINNDDIYEDVVDSVIEVIYLKISKQAEKIMDLLAENDTR